MLPTFMGVVWRTCDFIRAFENPFDLERRQGRGSIRIFSQRAAPSDVIISALCLKSLDHCWIGSVQGAVATWSAISFRYFLTILTRMV